MHARQVEPPQSHVRDENSIHPSRSSARTDVSAAAGRLERTRISESTAAPAK